MKPLLIVLTILVVAVGLVAAAIGLGMVEVAAVEPHWAPVEWLLATARGRAVAAGAAELTVPPLDDPRLLRRGIALYHRQCVACHGAPGVDPSPWAWGLNPFPPPLHDRLESASGGPAETYWVIDNGIRMSGMPAFGVTLPAEDLWSLTALVERLDELSAEDYAAMVRAGGGG